MSDLKIMNNIFTTELIANGEGRNVFLLLKMDYVHVMSLL